MAYQMDLPHRYVQLPTPPSCDEDERDSSESEDSSRRVHFDEHANQTFSISPHPKAACWFDRDDFARFSDNFKNFKSESITRSRRKQSLVAGGERVMPPMEMYQTFGTHKSRQNRRNMSKSVLLHQANCRAQGVLDPDGLSLVSKALSKNDQKQAWQAGALNAYETECFRDEEMKTEFSPMTADNMPSLFYQYYVDAVHPYLNSPLSVFSKVLLCECD